jgi:hypothetical protein
MTEPAAQPIFFVVDEDPTAVETLVGPSHSTASCTYSPAAARARRLALSAC